VDTAPLNYIICSLLFSYVGLCIPTKQDATSRKVAGSSPSEMDIFNSPNPSSRTMALGSTQPLTEMSTRNLPGGKGRSARKVGDLTAICEPIV
jgi:hypothetical protein